MNKRDMEKLDGLLVRLTAEFSDRHRQSTVIWRGEVRAIVAAIRAIKKDGADSHTGKGQAQARSATPLSAPTTTGNEGHDQ